MGLSVIASPKLMHHFVVSPGSVSWELGALIQGFLCSTWHQLRSFGSFPLDASLVWGIQEGFALMPGTSVGMVGSWPLWQADHCLADHAELPREGVAAASPLRHGGHKPAGHFFP